MPAHDRRRDPLLIVLIVIAAVVPAGLGLNPGGLPAAVLPFWLAISAVHLAYAVIANRVAGLYRGDGKHQRGSRRMWRLATWAGVAFLAGDLGQLMPAAHDPTDRASVIGTEFQWVMLLLAMVLLLVGLLRYPSGIGAGGDRSRLRMDVATVMAGATTCGLLLIKLPPGEISARWAATLATAVLIQPGLFLVALFALVKLFLGEKTPFTRVAGALSGVAAAIQVVLQAVPEPGYLAHREGAWLLGGNVLASTLLAIGARVQERQTRQDPGGLGHRPSRPYSWLPYGAMAMTWSITVGLLAVDGLTWRAWAVAVGAMVTTALVVARQMAAFRHIGELLRERDELTARLTEQAYHDALTGLANRALFMERLTESLRHDPVTVFLIDLDEFKPVNDRYGHATGDQLLIEVGRRLRRCVRAGDTVARLGGDEFAVLVSDLDERRRPEVAGALDAALRGTVRLGDVEVPLRASIGQATGHPGSHDPDALLHRADMAMYAEKNAARSVRR
ncbi:diguanylate cyclase domain-containing protein [Micromonosporaceae bacterium Da 78-11]